MRTYPHTRTQAFNLRAGMPVKLSILKPGTNDWFEGEGVVRKVVKTGASRVRITWEDRFTGKPVTRSVDAHFLVRLHRGFLAEHGIVLDTRKTFEEFFAAPKGAVL